MNNSFAKINLSAQTGFSATTAIKYKFTANGKICGAGGKPASDKALDVVAKAR
jgi:hypothetical protein